MIYFGSYGGIYLVVLVLLEYNRLKLWVLGNGSGGFGWLVCQEYWSLLELCGLLVVDCVSIGGYHGYGELLKMGGNSRIKWEVFERRDGAK